MGLPPDLVADYLARLGLDAEPPSVDALARLHRAHVERIPWETLWIHEGHRWDLDPTASATRIATTGRGGYCFHLNGALAALLAALGYEVTRHVGGVHGPDGPDVEMLTNHLVLLVSGLPAEGCPEGRWYVDVGMGDALHRPVPLAPGAVDHPPFRMELSTVAPGGVGDWHLAHDARGAFVGMCFGTTAVGMDAFAERHGWLSTSPDSNFVRLLVVQRRTPDTVAGLRGLTHTVVTATDSSTSIVDDRRAWFDLLADGFGIVPADPDPLWERVVRAHEERTP